MRSVCYLTEAKSSMAKAAADAAVTSDDRVGAPTHTQKTKVGQQRVTWPAAN